MPTNGGPRGDAGTRNWDWNAGVRSAVFLDPQAIAAEIVDRIRLGQGPLDGLVVRHTQQSCRPSDRTIAAWGGELPEIDGGARVHSLNLRDMGVAGRNLLVIEPDLPEVVLEDSPVSSVVSRSVNGPLWQSARGRGTVVQKGGGGQGGSLGTTGNDSGNKCDQYSS